MNKKQIIAQVDKLTAKKETAKNKKADLMKKCDAEINELDNQINKFKKVLEQMEKLEKQQQEQMEIASKLLSGTED